MEPRRAPLYNHKNDAASSILSEIYEDHSMHDHAFNHSRQGTASLLENINPEINVI